MDHYALLGIAAVGTGVLALLLFLYLSWRSAGRAKIDRGYSDDEKAPFDSASRNPMMDQYVRMLDQDTRPPDY